MVTLVETSNHKHLEVPSSESELRALPREAHAVRRILVCVDRSPFSTACLPHAVAMAKSLGSAITLLYVMPPPHERSGLQTTDVLDWEVSRQEANAYLERLGQEGTQASGRQVDTRLEQGHPAERITAVARELDADLTVLGSRGERGVAEWNLGTTALQVLAVARGSVLIARSDPSATGDVMPKRILVPLDGSLRAESALPTAVRIASAHAAELLESLFKNFGREVARVLHCRNIQADGVPVIVGQRRFIYGRAIPVVFEDRVSMSSGMLANQQVMSLKTHLGFVDVLELIVRLIGVNESLLVAEPDRHAFEDFAGQIDHANAALKNLVAQLWVAVSFS